MQFEKSLNPVILIAGYICEMKKKCIPYMQIDDPVH